VTQNDHGLERYLTSSDVRATGPKNHSLVIKGLISG